MNMLQLDVSPLGPDGGPQRFAVGLERRGVQTLAYGKHVLRMVTHCGVGPDEVERVVAAVAAAVDDFRLVGAGR
jgi:hypothetical protein